MKRFLLACLLVLFACGSAFADKQVTLAWDASPSPDVASYQIYYRGEGAAYDFNTPLAETDASILTTTVTIPTDGYFVARCKDASGNSSGNSNEVDTIPPGAPNLRITVVVDVTVTP